MHRVNPLKEIADCRKSHSPKGICSVCSINGYVIEAAFDTAESKNTCALIEATANQVNQFGGYSGMRPADFRDFVFSIADKRGFPRERILLGGDHLGPLVWKSESPGAAMEKAAAMVKEYVSAGFTKIHLDATMRLGGDDCAAGPDNPTIAERSAFLCRVSEEAYGRLHGEAGSAGGPFYVVGSEVPVPGGSLEEEMEVAVTRPGAFEASMDEFKKAFGRNKLAPAWDRVIAAVVQPGVEFGNESVVEYDREKSAALCRSLMKYPNIVFEGHSTDYQTVRSLRSMVEDGIAILKVGPALTFALREALFALCFIEEELLKGSPGRRLSNFVETLESTMLENPAHWKSHCRGGGNELKISRKYGFSDRCRYYLNHPDVKKSIEVLMENLNRHTIPMSLVSQFLPSQYGKIRNGLLENKPEQMMKDRVRDVLEAYWQAAGCGDEGKAAVLRAKMR